MKPITFGERWKDIILDDGDGHLRRATVPTPGMELAVGLLSGIAHYELHGMDLDGRLVYSLLMVTPAIP